jgi:hypothetical protein
MPKEKNMSDSTVYPRMPKSVWLKVREQFINAPPSTVTAKQLAVWLQCGEKNAQNLLPAFKDLGLIDDFGKLTPLAMDWRSDAKYDDVRQSMLEAIYPPNLRELFPGPKIDKKACKDWFLHRARLGISSAGQAADTYVLLNTPLDDLTSKTTKAGKLNGRKPQPRSEQGSTPSRLKPTTASRTKVEIVHPENRASDSASRHLDLHIHIPAEASEDQIDHIFASLAKHLHLAKQE